MTLFEAIKIYGQNINCIRAVTDLSLDEIFIQMIDAGHGLVIDFSQVPKEFLTDECVTIITIGHMISYMSEAERATTCLHEATHAEYMEQAGWITLFCTPGAVYRDGNIVEAGGIAWGAGPRMTDLERAKVALAPEMLVELLGGIEKDGAYKQDRRDLVKYLDERAYTLEERDRLIAKAKYNILVEAESETFRGNILKRARFYRSIFDRLTRYPYEKRRLGTVPNA